VDKIDAIIAKKNLQRKARWARLQRESPDTAECIEKITTLFGKPASLEVGFTGEKIEKWK